MQLEKKLEIARRILENAVKTNINKELILRISQAVDSYVVEYYRTHAETIKHDISSERFR